jgi:hypothetical protein
MLSIKLDQQTIILRKSWMRKHEINYHEKLNIIEFISRFCIHSRRIKTTSQEKKILFEKRSSFDQSNRSKLENSKTKKIVIKVLSRKELCIDQSSVSKNDEFDILNEVRNFKFNKINLKSLTEKKDKSVEINIAMIETFAFNMMS